MYLIMKLAFYKHQQLWKISLQKTDLFNKQTPKCFWQTAQYDRPSAASVRHPGPFENAHGGNSRGASA